MTVLSKKVLPNHGPYIRFADRPGPLRNDGSVHQCLANLPGSVFFEMPESLLGVYCSVTNSDSPIDPYSFVQLGNDFEIRKLISDLLIWVLELTRIRRLAFNKEVDEWSFYADTLRPQHGGDLTGEDLRLDMIETLLMLIGRLTRIARAKRWLVIDGI